MFAEHVWAIVGLAGGCLFLGIVLYGILEYISFSRYCEGHLRRAANASTLELADAELDTAITYLRGRGISPDPSKNQGWHKDYTSVLYPTPDEQVSFFMSNLIHAQTEVREIAQSPAATPVDRTNTLIKLRETLLDNVGNGKDSVTYPSGLSVYPLNARLAFLQVLGLVVLAVASTAVRLSVRS